MRRADLANRLISAATTAERKHLLVQHSGVADVRLAREIRKACYTAWTVDPIKAQRAAMAIRLLAKTNPNDEIQAISVWVTGISDITKAKFESAATNLETARARFVGIGRIADSAQTQVAKLLALAMLGRYDEAILTGSSTLKVFVSEGDELAAGKIEMNLSNIVSRRSLHREAEKYCLSARRRFIKAGENPWKAMAENGLANTYAELNDFHKADKFYRIALETARSEKMLVTEAEIEASLGNLALLRGRYSEALNFLERSRQKYDELAMPHQSAIADLEIADIYSELNLRNEAVDIYERVTNAFHHLKLRAEESRARLNFGRTAASQGDFSIANRELQKSLKLFDVEKNHSGTMSALLSLSELAIKQDNLVTASKWLKKALAALKQSENLRHKMHFDLLNGELHRKTGKLVKAVKHFSDSNAAARKYQQVNAIQFTLNALGKIAASRGKVAEARSFFKDAIKQVEGSRSSLGEETSMAFFGAKLEPYENLAQLLLAEEKFSEAFSVIESGRSRSLLDAAPEVSGHSSSASKKLANEMRELRSELNVYYKRFDSADESEAERLTADINRLEAKMSDTARRISHLCSSRSSRTNQKSHFGVKTVQDQLDESTTLVEFVEFDGKISAFVISKTSIRFVRDLTTSAAVNDTLEKLRFQFDALRYGSFQLTRYMNDLKSRTTRCLSDLYDQLLRPLANYLLGRRLIIVPVGSLNYVPFQALHDGSAYVIENFEIINSPSARVWSVLNARRATKIKNSLLMGFADERIPLVENEVREIESTVPTPTAFVSKKATFSAFVENAPKFDLIHLACHGRFRPENPMFSSLHLADGWITVRDICSQKLKASLVTLSACETGLSKIFAGEEILGLARGFLTAGADSLVVSLWSVNDAATGNLMRSFYDYLQRGPSIPASLRKAQLDFIKRGEHPFYWSPFVMIGK